VEDAERVLSGDGMTVATLWPHLVRGLVALRQGSHDDGDAIEAAWQLVMQLDEPVRRLAVLAALAERAWMTERTDDRVTTLARHEVTRLAGAPGAAWAVGELACWLARLDLLDDPAVPCAEPFRLTLTGRHDEAAAWWHAAGAVFAEALAWADSTDAGRRARGVELLDRNGATGTADRLRVALRRDGVTAVPSRPRGSTRANPGGLTNRQLEVAQLIARGFTNLEIASRLYISPKTADHHVSAVLNKLGHASRRTVMLHADELGLA
jgi:DNA-binding CsgD family transcriptional regulator